MKSCKGCLDRVVGCHATCEKYINEKAEAERIKALVNAGKYKDLELVVHIKDQRRKALKEDRR